MRKSVIYKLNDEEFRNLVNRSGSLCDVVKYFGLSINGSGGFHVIKKRIKILNIDCSHITRNIREKRQKNFSLRYKISSDKILVENSTYVNTHILKKRLIKEGLLLNNCYICKIDSWNGKFLSLQMDHINGNKTDNRIENLRLLCPNCHSQTINYAGKKNELPRMKRHCSTCGSGITAYSKTGLCAKCCLEITHDKNRIGQEVFYTDAGLFNSKSGSIVDCNELEQEIRLLGWEATGRKYGVCGNAIKKWAKKYGIHIASQKEFKLSISSSVCADFKNNGMLLKELAKKYKTSIHVIRNILLDNGLKEKGSEKKYKYGSPGIYFDRNRNDYSCYVRVNKKDKFLKRGFRTVLEAINYRNKIINIGS